MTARCQACGRAIRARKALSDEERRKRAKAATLRSLAKPIPKATRYMGSSL